MAMDEEAKEEQVEEAHERNDYLHSYAERVLKSIREGE
jgi:hypothetical protein